MRDIKNANALFNQQKYPEAIKEYLRIASEQNYCEHLIKQAYFNLSLIPRHYWRTSNKKTLTIDKTAKIWIKTSSSKEILSITEEVSELSRLNPAHEVEVSLFGIYQAIFCAFHKFYWNSSIKFIANDLLIDAEDEVLSSIPKEQREILLKTLIDILKSEGHHSFFDYQKNKISIISRIDKCIGNYLKKDRLLYNSLFDRGNTRSQVSVIIPYHSDTQDITRQLSSLLKNVGRTSLELEIIIIGHELTDCRKKVHNSLFYQLDIKVYSSHEKYSFSRYCNLATEKARFSNLLFLKSNILLEGDSINESIELIKSDNIGCVGVPLKYSSGKIKNRGLKLLWNNYRSCYLPTEIQEDFDIGIDNVAAISNYLLCQKSDFLMIGGFDESLSSGLEDIDLCLRVKDFLQKKITLNKETNAVFFDHENKKFNKNIEFKISDQDCRIFNAIWKERLTLNLNKKDTQIQWQADNVFISKRGYKSLVKDSLDVVNEKNLDSLLNRPVGVLNKIKFREESFSKGKLRVWIAVATESDFNGLRAGLVINGRLIKSTEIKSDRPDVSRALGSPAREALLTTPKEYFDGETHDIQMILYSDDFSFVIIKKIFKEKSIWLREREKAILAGKRLIFFASHNLKVQGAQTSLFQTVVGLKQDSRLYPVVFSPIDGPLRKSYEDQGIPVIIQSYPRISGTTEVTWKTEFEYFVSCLNSLAPHVVIANTLQSFHSAMASLALDIPTVLVPRESEDPVTYFSDIPTFLRKYADSLVGAVDQSVFVAKATRNLWSHADRGNQSVIYNGLAISELESKLAGVTRESARLTLGFGENERVILSVGTVCERKGQLDLLKAVPSITSRVPNKALKFVFVGMNDNEYSRAMEDVFARLPESLQSSVYLLPHTNDDKDNLVQQLYIASDLFVMNSIFESYPRVILEALYFGLPVISTRCFGVVEQIEEYKSGLFYEYGNYHELAKKVSSVIGSDTRLAEFSKEAYERFYSLTSFEEMVSDYKKLIINLIGSSFK